MDSGIDLVLRHRVRIGVRMKMKMDFFVFMQLNDGCLIVMTGDKKLHNHYLSCHCHRLSTFSMREATSYSVLEVLETRTGLATLSVVFWQLPWVLCPLSVCEGEENLRFDTDHHHSSQDSHHWSYSRQMGSQVSFNTETLKLRQEVVQSTAGLMRSVSDDYSVIMSLDRRLRLFCLLMSPAALYYFIRLVMILASPLFTVIRKIRSWWTNATSNLSSEERLLFTISCVPLYEQMIMIKVQITWFFLVLLKI